LHGLLNLKAPFNAIVRTHTRPPDLTLRSQ
jgi:hypothetical protein